jgi:transforming growth factor-beta-induced protein
MRDVLKKLGIVVVTVGVAACSDSSPVAPTQVATADAPGAVVAESRPGWAEGAKPGSSTIVEVVLQPDGEFDVLQAAVVRAGLVDALNGTTQYTVFAPTDAAFVQTLGVADEAAAIAAIDAMPVDTLTNILLYHVTDGRRNSRSVLAAPSYTMLNGATLTRDALVTAGIATPDVSVRNGIIHIINAVLLPA